MEVRLPQVTARTPLVRRGVPTGRRPDGRLGTVTTVRAMIITPDLDRVTELGGTVLSPPADMPWGQRVVHLRDPDGNAVDLTQGLETAA